MTTTETTQLEDIVRIAGNGGTIAHVGSNGAEYIVVHNDSGRWGLTSAGDDPFWINEPIESFIRYGWAVVSEGERKEDESLTTAQFFSSCNMCDIVRHDVSNDLYIFYGRMRDEKGDYVFRLYSTNWFDVLNVPVSEAELENNEWSRTENTVDRGHLDVIILLFGARKDRDTYCDGLASLNEKHQRVMDDLRVINDKLCEFAVDKGYCPEFEAVIGKWNEALQEVELLGRPRDFRITVKMNETDNPLYWDVYYTARSEREALQAVSHMSNRDIVRSLLDRGHCFEELSFFIESSEDEGVE